MIEELNPTTPTSSRPATVSYSAGWTAAVFVLGAIAVGGTVAGPGLSWDEPAYRHSQITLQNWLRELRDAPGWDERAELFSADAIDNYWEYNRFGHNFHPPMGGYLNLLTYAAVGRWWNDISSRRLASALELAATAALLCHFLGRRYGAMVGLFSALSLLTMPRVVGDAHLIGTDVPMLFFWSATALAFYRGITDRRWQWLCAGLLGCLFLVKFSGVVIVGPLLVWVAIEGLIGRTAFFRSTAAARWLLGALVLLSLLAPVVVTLVWGMRAENGRGVLYDVARWGMRHPGMMLALMLVPLAGVLVYYSSREPKSAPVWLEFPWVMLAVAPLVAIALNPTWWHQSVPALARFFDLNLNRAAHLPNINIFYLGQQYVYSLPKMNAFVLMAVTIPFGTLMLGAVGCCLAIAQFRTDRLPAYILLHALTLPLFRMLPTPAHDGVRLFLPTFFFWAGLAGLAAGAIVARMSRSPAARRLTWTALLAIGPGWAGADCVRIHPYELSYYNVGLARAMDWGFEPTYWYDAVTPAVLRELNEKLPRDVPVGLPDPLINTEVFVSLQELGVLRADIQLDLDAIRDQGFPWYWLLTHSSKATAFTRLLHACPPWYESSHEEVRLFSVVDAKSTELAWALHLLTVNEETSKRLGSLKINEPIFNASADEIRRSIELATASGGTAPFLEKDSALVRELTERWRRMIKGWRAQDPPVDHLDRLLRSNPNAMNRAIRILTTRREDVRKVLEYPGYLRPERFGGYFE